MSLLFVEAYLAAGRDESSRDGIGEIPGELRSRVTRWLAEHRTPDPAGTATVLIAAVDGLLLHRALKPDELPEVEGVPRRLVRISDDEETSR